VAGHRRTQALGIFAGVCIALLVAAASREHDRVPGLSDPAAGSVTFDRLRAADGDPRNWLTYSGQYSGQRFSRLGSINQSTV
jgi:glucose dehydrogenase